MAKLPEEQMIRSRARRRLIGAVALALAVVVILPMVLDSEPKVTGQDIDLRIPDPGKVGEFVPGAAISEVSEAATLAESAVSPVAVSAVQAEKMPESMPVSAASGKITQAGPDVREQTGKQPENSQPEIKQPEIKRAGIKGTQLKQVSKTEAKPAVTFIVQVGAFSNAETADGETGKLKAMGFKAYTENISGTTRVRVGPYVERSKADEVRKLLEKHGLHPVITEVK